MENKESVTISMDFFIDLLNDRNNLITIKRYFNHSKYAVSHEEFNAITGFDTHQKEG